MFPWIYGTIWGVNVFARFTILFIMTIRYIHMSFDFKFNGEAGLIV